MKKVISNLLILLLIIIPITVNAKDECDKFIKIEKIELEKTEGTAVELNEAKIENSSIKLDLKFKSLGDTAIYKVLLKNESNEDYIINKDIIQNNSKYINSTVTTKDNSRILGSNKEKEVLLMVEYNKRVDDELFENNEYKLDEEMLINLINNKTNNPLTSTGITTLIIILIITILFTIYKKKKMALLLLLGILFVPISGYAVCNATIKINSKITFEKESINNCHFNGELTRGAEYINGQYVYRYMQEAKNRDTWKDIDEGWGMRLVDRASTEPVTTEMCTYINDIPVTSMAWAFFGNDAPKDLSSFNTTNIKSMQSMFNLANIDGIDFNRFDTSNVTNFSGMFLGVNKDTLDLHGFNTSKATDMSAMFSGSELNSLDITNFDMKNVTTTRQMFIQAKINNLNLQGLNTSKVENMNWMFREFEGNINLTGINTSQVTDMGGMFQLSKTNNLDFSSFDTRNVTNMDGMFDSAEMEIIDISSFEIPKVDSIKSLFIFTTARVIDISGFNPTKTLDLNNTFSGATNLETIYASASFNPAFLTHTESSNFSRNTKLKGMNGTSCSSVEYENDLLYMRIDQGTSSPGCFSLK